MTEREGRIAEEKRTVELMIRYYCEHRHDSDALCPDCEDLLAYARSRLENCRYGNDKPTCRKCKTHCYSPEYRDRIKTVMRFSGPRMMFTAPLRWIRHVLHDRE
ncbi:nitrous oxide-stimulated promoter family protein [Candidatus Thorarchaeota archaeon]|nr:MAG: nitrous oxide-stimulated promoter family protein [Candidatus Thorarchaeota archaeon]